MLFLQSRYQFGVIDAALSLLSVSRIFALCITWLTDLKRILKDEEVSNGCLRENKTLKNWFAKKQNPQYFSESVTLIRTPHVP